VSTRDWSAMVQAGFRSLVQDGSCSSARRRGPVIFPHSISAPLLEVPPVFDEPVFPSPPGTSGSRGGVGSTSLAGLENASGCNHCFLNVVIQAFFNLQSFRCRLLWAPDHPHGLDDDGRGADSREAEAENCCFCALQALFKQMQLAEGGGGSLPPDDLRRALSRVYDARGRFRLGEMEDAAETIEALLGVLHACNVQTSQERELLSCGSPSGCTGGSSSCCCSTVEECQQESVSSCGGFTSGGSSSSTAKAASGARTLGSSAGSRHGSRPLLEVERVEEASNFGCHPLCIAHEVFGVECVDLTRCTFCGATSEPIVTSSFLYCAYVADLLAAAEADSGHAAPPPPAAGERSSLQGLLRGLCQREAGRRCGECSSLRTVFAERWLTRQPLALVVSLVWPCSTPSAQAVWRVLRMLRPELRLDEVFRVARPGSPRTQRPERVGPVEADARAEAHAFRGFVCYSGMHYVALFWCWSRTKWIVFDDTSVHEERDWTSVAAFIMGGKYVPTLAFFEDVHRGELTPPECSVREFRRQMGELEDRQRTCTVM